MSVIKKILKSTFTYLIMIVGLLGVFLTQTILSIDKMSSDNHSSIYHDYNYHFSLDVGDVDTNQAQEFIRGAEEAAARLEIALEIKGANSSYDDKNSGFIQWATNTQTDAIITLVSTEEDVAALSNSSYNNSVALCMVFNRIPGTRTIYVGPDNYEEGYELAAALNDKYEAEHLYIGLLVLPVEAYIPNGRFQGFLDGVEAFDNMDVLETRSVESGVLLGMGVAEDIMLNNENINYLVSLDETLLVGAARGIIDLNRVKTVQASGIGYSEEIASYVSKKIIDVAIDINAYQIGKYAIEAAYNQKKNKSTDKSKDIVTPVIVIGGSTND